jgi:uncharacterized repeat protein (TIGR03803 family)
MTNAQQNQESRARLRSPTLGLAIVALIALALASPQSANAQTLTTLYSFCSQGGSACTDGTLPYAAFVKASDGNFYGTTHLGGANGNYGTVFRITPSAAFNTLYSFCSQSNCTDGDLPYAALVEGSDGNFYGTTEYGGAGANCPRGPSESCGTVFKITPSGTLSHLYSFCSQVGCVDGYDSYATLVQGSDGNFYGTTSAGGGTGAGGTVFKITPSGTLTTLYSFCSQSNCTDGDEPLAGLVQGSDGDFYGTTYRGGSNAFGTVFKITPSGTLTTLYSFCSQINCTDGYEPWAGLVQGSDGDFYGTTQHGGANGDYGTVFKITPSGTLTTLYSFCSQSNCRDGENSYAGLVEGSDGNFYGTTAYGGGGHPNPGGTVFKITPSGTLTTLYHFCSLGGSACPHGDNPYAALVQGGDGSFYGTTTGGGTNGVGTVFNLTLPPPVTLTPSSANFGNVPQATSSAPKNFTLKNNQSTSLTISSIAFTGANAGDFSHDGTCGNTLAAKASCNVSVTFTPSIIGSETATLTVTDNASNSPQTASLAGKGVAQAVVSPTSLTFAAQKVGTTSAAKTVTLTNNLSTALTFNGVTFTGANAGDYASPSSTCGASVPAKGKCTVSVTFKPTATGARSATLNVNDSANNSPQTVSLTGTGK